MKSYLSRAAALVFCCSLAAGPSSWAKAMAKDATETPAAATIKPVAATPQLLGAEFTVNVMVGSVQKLFGASFELQYTNPHLIKLVAPTSSSVAPGAFLGSDVVFFSNLDTTNGKIGVGISRKIGQATVSGSGVLASFKFKSLLSTPNGTAVKFSLNDVTANDSLGTPLPLVASDSTIAVLGLLVYPGDTNNDKLVNQNDVLPIGLNFGKTGPVRPNATMLFSAQPVFPWTPNAATYADANGNGLVNQADILPIGLNWAKTHNAPSLVIAAPENINALHKITTVNISAAMIGAANSGQDFWVEVRADDAQNLFGAAFELLYSPIAAYEPLAVAAGDWMGSDILFMPNVDQSAGKISIGLSRKAGQSGVDGAGVLARVKMRAAKNTAALPAPQFTLQNGAANDPAGHPIQLRFALAAITSGASASEGHLPTAFALHPNLPNPLRLSASHAGTMIHYDLPEPAEIRVDLYDILGKHVATLINQRQPAGRHAVEWNGRDERGQLVAAGVFIYQLRVKGGANHPSTSSGHGFMQSRKLVLLR